MKCKCFDNGMIDVVGLCDVSKFDIDQTKDQNWTEISIPEIFIIPHQKPDVENINKVYVKVKIVSTRVVDTPAPPIKNPLTPNAEGTTLTGKKLIVEGLIKQKIVYTADVPEQTVHSAHSETLFSSFIILNNTVDLEDEFCVYPCIEDVYVKAFNKREIFKNITLFLTAVNKENLCP